MSADIDRAARPDTELRRLQPFVCKRPLAGNPPVIQQRGLTLVGVAVANLENDRAIQLALPFDRYSGGALDRALDEVRRRFGTAAVTRAVLLGRERGLEVPLLPD